MVTMRATFEEAYREFLRVGATPEEANRLALQYPEDIELAGREWAEGQRRRAEFFASEPGATPLQVAGLGAQLILAPYSIAGSGAGAILGEQIGGRTGGQVGEIVGGLPFAAVSQTPRAIGQTAAPALARTINPTIGEQAGRVVGKAVAPVRRAAGEVASGVGAALERRGVPSPVSVASATMPTPTGAAGAVVPPAAPATVTRVPNREELNFLRLQTTERMRSVRSEIGRAAKAADQTKLASLRQQLQGLEDTRGLIRSGKYLMEVDPSDPAERLASAIEQAGTARRTTEAMYGAERSRRLGRAIGATEGVPATQKGMAFKSQLGGPLPKPGFAPVADMFTPEDTSNLFQRIWAQDSPLQPFEKLNADDALKAILLPEGGVVPRQFEIELLERVFGPRLSVALLNKRTGWERIGPQILDAMNIPKTLRSAFDASAPLRQGVFLAPRHPLEWAGNLKNMVRAMASERAADDIYESILLHPNYDRLVTQGRLSIIDPLARHAGGSLAEREEFFFSRLASKIPGIGASGRAYTTFLNKLRFDVANKTLSNWEKAGVEIDDAVVGRMASFLNKATGRGSFGRAETIVPYLSAGFWSPRLAISRFQVPYEVFRQGGRAFTGGAADRLLARQMAEELVAFVGTGAAILTLVHKSGMGSVELDPRSTDFGKIRVGGITVDFWGGFQQAARYAAQIATAQRRPITTSTQKDYVRTTRLLGHGERETINGVPGTYRLEKVAPFDTLGRFIWSKLSPGVPTIAAAELNRQTFSGEKLSDQTPLLGVGPDVSVRLEQYIEQFTPLFELQLAEAIAQEGWAKGSFTTLPVALGVGTDIMPETTTEQVPRPAKSPTAPTQKGLWR